MKELFLSFLMVAGFSALHAQATAPEEKNDPQAKKVLDKIRKKYEDYKTVELAFSLISEVPGQNKDTQKGLISQDGEQFRLEMDQQIIVSDGKTTWVYLKKNNEVQINNAEPNDSENGFMTPKDLLKRYQKGDFLYAVTDKLTEGGKVYTQVEFKPKNRDKSDYTKIRISIDEKGGTIQNIKAFAKDGSRFTFNITRLTPNKKFGSDQFKFDPKKYPGVKVEDLRM